MIGKPRKIDYNMFNSMKSYQSLIKMLKLHKTVNSWVLFNSSDIKLDKIMYLF